MINGLYAIAEVVNGHIFFFPGKADEYIRAPSSRMGNDFQFIALIETPAYKAFKFPEIIAICGQAPFGKINKVKMFLAGMHRNVIWRI